jgi:hypothetical protein
VPNPPWSLQGLSAGPFRDYGLLWSGEVAIPIGLRTSALIPVGMELLPGVK